jgi:hypothetical protein
MTIVVRCSLIGPMGMQLRMHSFFLSQEYIHCSIQPEHRNASMVAAGEQQPEHMTAMRHHGCSRGANIR